MKLPKSEDKKRQLFHDVMFDSLKEVTRSIIGVQDLKGKYLFVNPAFEKISGWELSEIIGSARYDLVHPEDRRKLKNMYADCAGRGMDAALEWRLRCKSGDYVWLETYVHVIKDPINNTPKCLGFSARNIEKRKKLEIALKMSEQKYRALMDKSPDAIFIADMNGNLIDLNPMAASITGYSKKELIGMHFKKLHPPAEMDKAAKAFNRIIQSKRSRIFDLKVLTKDGRIINMDVNGCCFKIHDQILVKGVFRDMTEQMEIQEQLRKAKTELEARVVERTMELMEANTTLKVILSHREKEKSENEEKLLMNLQGQIFPHIQELKNNVLNASQAIHIRLLEKNLQNIMSEFLTHLQSNTSKFTPKEIQVASLIKEGLRTKDIAKLMNVSTKTVDIFRYNIRKKLGLNNQGTNLMAHLVSL